MARSLRAVALVAFLAVISQHAAALPISKGQGVSMPMSGVSLTNVLSRAFKPYAAKPPVEVAVPTVEWRPVTVLTPTLQVYKMGFCIPRNQWTAVSADAVDCPPQTYLQNNNGRVVCARTDCAGPVGKTVQPAAEQQQKTLLGAAYFAVKKSMPQAWGGTAAAICSTVFVQPIMACPQNCISDVRQGPDMCLCDAGLMGCPYNYEPCGCSDFTVCVADMYFCDYYCKYAPSWYFALVAKGEKACPIDPTQLDPLNPDPVYPGATAIGSNVIGRRRLMAAAEA